MPDVGISRRSHSQREFLAPGTEVSTVSQGTSPQTHRTSSSYRREALTVGLRRAHPADRGGSARPLLDPWFRSILSGWRRPDLDIGPTRRQIGYACTAHRPNFVAFHFYST